MLFVKSDEVVLETISRLVVDTEALGTHYFTRTGSLNSEISYTEEDKD